MKLKTISIQIKSLDEALDEFVEIASAVKKGHKVTPKKGTYIADPETARAIFTESRLKIIQLLKTKAPDSIYALAKILKRDFKNVYDDVLFLAEIGLISLKESRKGRKQKKPQLICEDILFKLAA